MEGHKKAMQGTLQSRLAGTAFFIENFSPSTLRSQFERGQDGTFSLQQGRQSNAVGAKIRRTDDHYVITVSHPGLPPQITLPRDEQTATAFEQGARYITTTPYRCGEYEVQIIRSGKGDELVIAKAAA